MLARRQFLEEMRVFGELFGDPGLVVLEDLRLVLAEVIGAGVVFVGFLRRHAVVVEGSETVEVVSLRKRIRIARAIGSEEGILQRTM
jgi:hypothetical protein